MADLQESFQVWELGEGLSEQVLPMAAQKHNHL
jgi:hypothetical protein